MSGKGGASVPKFPSFRPRATDSKEHEASSTSARNKGENDSPRKHSHRHHRRLSNESSGTRSHPITRDLVKSHAPDVGGKHVEDRERPHKCPRSNDNSQIAVQQDVSHKQQDPESSLFFMDTRGDSQNLVYGRLHRYDVPSFHRIGGGSVLGAPTWLRIDKQSAIDDNGLVLGSRQSEARHREKYAFSRVEKKGMRLLRILPEASPVADAELDVRDADFISLSRTCRRARRESEDDSNDDKQHYRSMEGKAKSTKDEDVELVSGSGSEADSSRQTTYDKSLQQKTINLSRAVEREPTNIEAWYDLIEHQEYLLEYSTGNGGRATTAEKRSTADIKIHLYEKALEKLGADLKSRERLLVSLMEEGSKIWDFKTQADRWQKISQQNPESLELWKKYVNFQQTNFQSFHYEQVRDSFADRISQLKSIIMSENASQLTSIENLVYALLRVTLLMREAGFTELAIGIWQGILDYNFSQLPSAQKRTLASFQDYWEAESLRIGENGSSGWQAYLTNLDTSEPPAPRTDQVSPRVDGRGEDLLLLWASAEKSLAVESRMPARTMDDVAENDPFRVILWSDISDYLIDLTQVSEDSRALLIDAFLMFSGQPPLVSDEPRASSQWWAESFIRQADPVTVANKSHTDASQSLEEMIASEVTKSEEQIPFLNQFVPSPDTMFPLKGMPQYVPSSHAADLDARWPVPYPFVLNVLRRLSSINAATGIAEYLLAFELANEPSTVKKVAKKLLKESPTNIKLYNAYALIEAAKGNTDTAINVIMAALAMHKPKEASEVQHDTILLWKSWIWISLEQGDVDGACKCLLSIPSGILGTDTITTASPAVLLRCKQYLSTTASHLLSIGSYTLACHYTECLAFFSYFSSTTQSDIGSALSITTSFTDSLHAHKAPTTTIELLHQSAARLLLYHIQTSKSYRPSTIRHFLTSSLNLFSQNTILLSAYARNERHLRIDNRVRQILLSTVLLPKHDCLTSRLFAILHERRVGNVHSLHAAFENAISNPVCASSAGLWRMYIRFCAEHKEYSGRLKNVFLRGMRACPWSKDLLIEGMRIGGVALGWDTLKAVYGVCGEKGLRVHVDLEDILEGMDGWRGDRNG